jgi:hypothetical protein
MKTLCLNLGELGVLAVIVLHSPLHLQHKKRGLFALFKLETSYMDLATRTRSDDSNPPAHAAWR